MSLQSKPDDVITHTQYCDVIMTYLDPRQYRPQIVEELKKDLVLYIEQRRGICFSDPSEGYLLLRHRLELHTLSFFLEVT